MGSGSSQTQGYAEAQMTPSLLQLTGGNFQVSASQRKRQIATALYVFFFYNGKVKERQSKKMKTSITKHLE